jgi:hypothetical protein
VEEGESVADEREVQVELVCVDMPGSVFEERTGVRLGVQERQQVVDDLPADTEPAVFWFAVRVKGDPRVEDPDFAGPYVQGRRGQRFVYLCWGERIDGVWNGFRRAKLSLHALPWHKIGEALETGSPLRATLRMSDERGGPVAASLKAERVDWT